MNDHLEHPRENYATWEETFFRKAYVIADRSKDPSTQVGAVIVTAPDATINGHPVGNRTLSEGYNGTPTGWPDDQFNWGRTGPATRTKYALVIHAEINAILNFFGDTSNLRGAVVYVTHFPCYTCFKHLAQLGISEVVYDQEHTMPDEDAVAITMNLAENCNIRLRHSPQDPNRVRLSV